MKLSLFGNRVPYDAPVWLGIAGRTGAVDLALASTFLLSSVAAAVIGATSIFGGVGSYYARVTAER